MAAVDVASMLGVVLSEELPGMLRRRPVLSGGDSVSKEGMCLICETGLPSCDFFFPRISVYFGNRFIDLLAESWIKK